MNVAVVWPAATETLAGTLAIEGSWLARATAAPLAGAAPERVTVPVVEAPPVTLFGVSGER